MAAGEAAPPDEQRDLVAREPQRVELPTPIAPSCRRHSEPAPPAATDWTFAVTASDLVRCPGPARGALLPPPETLP